MRRSVSLVAVLLHGLFASLSVPASAWAQAAGEASSPTPGALPAPAQTLPTSLRFDFGSGPVAEGCTAVDTSTLYTPARGYGLLSGEGLAASAVERSPARDALHADALVGAKPFAFVVDLPEGNYEVTVLLGDPAGAADTTVKAESRRLLLEGVKTPAGRDSVQARTFTVNIRTPQIGTTDRRVSLKTRERDYLHWDDKLFLEFNGSRPAVAGLDIRRNDAALTVYLAGDSTVTDQPGEPWCSWGQMLPRFFPAGVAVANHAESGLSFASFRDSSRLDKILSTLRPGDYVFMQFAHNDQKEKGEGVGAFTTYAASIRDYVAAIREHGGQPVLVTSMYRRRFDEQGELYDTLGDFPAATRQVAAELAVPLIDLHAMSAKLFSALGAEPSKAAFVHFPAGAYGSEKEVKDDTHFSPYGAYELARCIVEGIRQNVPALAARLAPDVEPYDPAHPADPAEFAVPPSPPREAVRIPDGDGR